METKLEPKLNCLGGKPLQEAEMKAFWPALEPTSEALSQGLGNNNKSAETTVNL